jgi:hypothetical protein
MTSTNTHQTTADHRAQGLRRLAAAAIAAVALTAGLVAPATSSAAGTPTQITIEAQLGGFFGYVSSPNEEDCEANRTVVLYKVKGSGGLKQIGSDNAQPNGPDSMYAINTNKKGRFLAKALAGNGCAAATSPIVYAQK